MVSFMYLVRSISTMFELDIILFSTSSFPADVDPNNVGSVDYEQFLEISKCIRVLYRLFVESKFYGSIHFFIVFFFPFQWLSDMQVEILRMKYERHSNCLTTITPGKSP